MIKTSIFSSAFDCVPREGSCFWNSLLNGHWPRTGEVSCLVEDELGDDVVVHAEELGDALRDPRLDHVQTDLAPVDLKWGQNNSLNPNILRQPSQRDLFICILQPDTFWGQIQFYDS